MKKTLRSIAVITAILLAGCSTVSTSTDSKGVKQETTDFKASADANAKMYEAQADVMWNAHEAVKSCYTKATTDIAIMACSMTAQSVNFGQAVSGRPQPNRNPQSGTEANADVAKSTVGAAAKVGQVAAVAAAASDVANSVASVQAKDPQIVTQPPPVVVRPEVVLIPGATATTSAATTP